MRWRGGTWRWRTGGWTRGDGVRSLWDAAAGASVLTSSWGCWWPPLQRRGVQQDSATATPTLCTPSGPSLSCGSTESFIATIRWGTAAASRWRSRRPRPPCRPHTWRAWSSSAASRRVSPRLLWRRSTALCLSARRQPASSAPGTFLAGSLAQVLTSRAEMGSRTTTFSAVQSVKNDTQLLSALFVGVGPGAASVVACIEAHWQRLVDDAWRPKIAANEQRLLSLMSGVHNLLLAPSANAKASSKRLAFLPGSNAFQPTTSAVAAISTCPSPNCTPLLCAATLGGGGGGAQRPAGAASAHGHGGLLPRRALPRDRLLRAGQGHRCAPDSGRAPRVRSPVHPVVVLHHHLSSTATNAPAPGSPALVTLAGR